MKGRKLFAVALATVLVVGAVLIARQTWATPKMNQEIKQTAADDEIPDRIFYGETLTLLARLKNVQDYQAQAQLSDEQADFLRVTAEQCAERIAKQDAIAAARIVALQQRLKGKPSRLAPSVPAEISELQAQRNSIVLNCRDVIRARLGDDKFQQFRLAAKSLVKIQASRVR